MESVIHIQAADEVLMDDLLLDVFSFLTARELHKAAAPVCKRWAKLALGSQLWEEWLPKELCMRGTAVNRQPRTAAATWLTVFHTNLLQNPCFLLSHQQMDNPHDMSSPWQSVCPDRKTFVWEDDLVAADPHRVAQVPLPMRPHCSPSWSSVMKGDTRPHIIMPPRMWAEIRQTVDLIAILRARGFGIVNAIRFLESGPHLCLKVRSGRTAWRTGNRQTFEYEVGLLADDGGQPVAPPGAHTSEELSDRASVTVWHRSGVLNGEFQPDWSTCIVDILPEASRDKGIRRAIVVLRARSYPGLVGGCFASPELTFISPAKMAS